MRPFLSLLLLLLVCSPAFAQPKTGQARLDSLLAELPRAKPDTNRVSLLIAISSSYSPTNPGSSYSRINSNEDIKYANQALELARQLAWEKGMLLPYLYLGNAYANRSNYPQAMTAYLSGLKIAEETKDKRAIIATSLAMGNIYTLLANYSQALAYYEKLLKGSEESGNKSGVIISLNNIGSVYSEQGEYAKALDYRLKSLQLNEAMGFQGPPKEMNFDNVGQSYLNLANYPQALTYLQVGLNLSKANRNRTILVKSYNNLSKLYFKIATDSNATSLTTLLRSNKTSTLQKASAYADSAIVLAKEQGDLRYLYRAYQTQSQIQDALGDPQAALSSYQDFIKTKDLVINQQNSNQIAVATLQYDFDKKETALQFQQQLTAAQLQKQTLLTKQQAQELSLKAQAAQLANKERDLQRLEYLQEKAAKQDKEKQLALSQKEQALKATDLELSQAEVKNQTQQRTYLLGGVGVLAALLGLIAYGYTQKQKANVVLQQQKEEINQKSSQLEQSLTELRATQTQLIQKEKMASLGELTAGIAHEIQNPLNFVNNFSEVSTELVSELRDEEGKADRDTELIGELLIDLSNNLQKINHHGGRASAIVKGMLEHSRSGTGERRPTNPNALADEYLKIAYHGLRAKDKDFNCDLITDFDPAVGQVTMMPQEIGRVLLNLYNNAFYAVKEKKKTAPPTYQPTITVRTQALPGGKGVGIRVGDNGMGIPDAVKTKIFQPFFTTKPTGEGTGLGLSLSYDIVTKGHGGTLTVESVAGEGTAFTINLPALS